MSDRVGPKGTDLVDLFGNRPGWRLEPRSTPGATPLWCFVFGGKIEFSVTVDGRSIHLYIMETDQDLVFDDPDGLMDWLRSNRAEALREPTPPRTGSSRLRKLFEWK